MNYMQEYLPDTIFDYSAVSSSVADVPHIAVTIAITATAAPASALILYFGARPIQNRIRSEL